MSMISEQIEKLRLMAEMFVNGEPYGNLLRRAADTIEMLSEKVRADRPQGEWTNTGVLTVRCSNCKSEFHELEAMNFCPNCGADMRGEKDETD